MRVVGIVALVAFLAVMLLYAFKTNEFAKPDESAPPVTAANPTSTPAPAPSAAVGANSPANSAVQTPPVAAQSISNLPYPSVRPTYNSKNPPWAPGSLAQDMLAARTPEQALWLDMNGYPRDFNYDSWDKAAVEAAAEAGDLTAQHMRTLLRLEAGEDRWDRPSRAQQVSPFIARLRAAYNMGMIGPGERNRRNGRYRLLTPVNMQRGLLWDLIAQRLGENSIMDDLPHFDNSPMIDPIDLGYAYRSFDDMWSVYGRGLPMNLPRKPRDPLPDELTSVP